ncbi:hypothetical protein [Vibrio ouci]|uniref:Uncharacterized protein n=1 Tax=Vibrio ouci TaxID=2499078 RepID=A0A4Y8WGY2_9VIBR|nr:hypothetical protein [Vibrio ouci]TFH91933.1 hypothetical protein ELS82_09380 [Vibrio ouci]
MKLSIMFLSILLSINAFASDDRFWNRQFFQNMPYTELVTDENRVAVKPIFLEIDEAPKGKEWSDTRKVDVLMSVLATYLSDIAYENQATYQSTLVQFQSGKLNSALSAMYLNDEQPNVVQKAIAQEITNLEDEQHAKEQKVYTRKKFLECVIQNMRGQPANMRDVVSTYCKLEQNKS